MVRGQLRSKTLRQDRSSVAFLFSLSMAMLEKLSDDLTELLDAPRDSAALARATESTCAFSRAKTVAESGFVVLTDGTFAAQYGAWDLARLLLEALRLTCKAADAPPASGQPTEVPDGISGGESSSDDEEDFGQSDAFVNFQESAWQAVDGLLQNKLPMHQVREVRNVLRMSPKEAVLVSTAALEDFANEAQAAGGAARALHSLLHRLIALTQDLVVDPVNHTFRVKPSIARSCVAAVHNSLGAFFDVESDDSAQRVWPSLQSDWFSLQQASALAVCFHDRLIAALDVQQLLKSGIVPSSPEDVDILKHSMSVCLLDVASLITTYHSNDDDNIPEASKECSKTTLLLGKVCSALERMVSSTGAANSRFTQLFSLSTASNVDPSVVEWEHSQCSFLDRRRVR